MGLDVIVFKVVMPKDTLATVEKVSAFEAENECSFHTVENCPAIIGSKFEVEAPIEYIDAGVGARAGVGVPGLVI